jgi:hypothetical protein
VPTKSAPRAAVGVAITTTAASAVLLLVENVVLVVLDRLRVENAVDLVATRVFIGPSLDGLEHVALDFNALTAKSRVVESAENIVYNLVNWHARVLPSVENTRYCVLEDSGGHTSSTRVENICEVIL